MFHLLPVSRRGFCQRHRDAMLTLQVDQWLDAVAAVRAGKDAKTLLAEAGASSAKVGCWENRTRIPTRTSLPLLPKKN
jgi:hypothetical protein